MFPCHIAGMAIALWFMVKLSLCPILNLSRKWGQKYFTTKSIQISTVHTDRSRSIRPLTSPHKNINQNNDHTVPTVADWHFYASLEICKNDLRLHTALSFRSDDCFAQELACFIVNKHWGSFPWITWQTGPRTLSELMSRVLHYYTDSSQTTRHVHPNLFDHLFSYRIMRNHSCRLPVRAKRYSTGGGNELLTWRIGAALSWMDRMCVMLFLANCSRSLASEVQKPISKDHECSQQRSSAGKLKTNHNQRPTFEIPQVQIWQDLGGGGQKHYWH